MDANIPNHLKGLTEAEVQASRQSYGYNETEAPESTTWYLLLLGILKEPMLLLLLAVTTLYVIVGNYAEAAFMFGAIVAVSAISFYQDNRSKKALEALQKLNEPLSTVIRYAAVVQISTREIVVGDLCIVEEGKMVSADGTIVHSNDFSVNESALTGESLAVFKSSETPDKNIYSGTLVASGLAVFKVTSIGAATRLAKIGQSLHDIREEVSPLQKQITRFVQLMAVVGVAVFLMVWLYSYWQSRNIIDSLLVGLTLAMSILPEEIPVAFTTFMALGAWKLMREGIIIKRSSIVETLGSTTVICADKTGTITKNTMQLKLLYDFQSNQLFSEENFEDSRVAKLIAYAMWSSEPVPFDPMELALHQAYQATHAMDERTAFRMVHEYPLGGKPPMMTHVFESPTGERIIAAKGAPEAILAVSSLSAAEKEIAQTQLRVLSTQGYRVLGVAQSVFAGSQYPEQQQELPFVFLGFVVFYDPPKENIREVFQKIYQAGIKVKVITGDNAETTNAIARQAGINNTAPTCNGADIISHSEKELQALAESTTLFTRMFPEAKLAIVNALKKNGEVVAMLGDGVNDGPALKAAHIGVAMGHKGTEIAKAAASLIITNDDLDKLILGIAAGRRIYTNIKKAIQYIISIHIPIILTVSLPLFLGWIYPEIFTPVHVIFLELIMGPTCSIVYENEPIEQNAMTQMPRKMTDTFLSWRELSISIIQGLAITAGVLLAYRWSAARGNSEEHTRAIVFTTLLFANILLSYTNRSFYYSIVETLRSKNYLLTAMTALTLLLLFVILYVPAVSGFFQITSPEWKEVGVSFVLAALAVLWIEFFKLARRTKNTERS